MNKKVISISIAALFVLLTIFSTSAVSESEDTDSNNKNLVQLQSLVRIEWDDIEPIMPRSGSHEYNLHVTYSITTGMFLSDLILKLNEGKQVDIKLDVVDVSDGCQFTILDSILSTVVSEGEQELATKFAISIDETVPAYSGCYAKINITVEPIKGPLGILTMISGFQKEVTITFEPDYLPLIKPVLTDGNLIEISPFNETKIPISIENLGNDMTRVLATIEEYPETWNVTISESIIIDIGNTTQTFLNVITDNNFDEEMITIELTPARALNLNERGAPQRLTLILKNDGSYKEKEENEMSTTLILLVAVILLILIIFVLFLVVIRKKE